MAKTRGKTPAELEHYDREPRQSPRGEQGLLRMNLTKGFTLIELLVVIAIIAILAGIIFPVYARTKDSAYRSSDMSNMNAIRTALQLYKADQGAFPPALLGYATGYLPSGQPGDPNPTPANIVPANQLVGALYPKRVDSLATLTPAYDRVQLAAPNSAFSTALWPNGLGMDKGPGQPDQRFGPLDGPATRAVLTGDPANPCVVVPRYYYKISGYDSATVPDGLGGMQNELRYTLFWSGYTVPSNPCSPTPGGAGVGEQGSAADDPRQLGYSDPPDTTVVTWDTYFRDPLDPDLSNQPPHNKRDIVLFLGGGAKAFDSNDVWTKSWKVQP